MHTYIACYIYIPCAAYLLKQHKQVKKYKLVLFVPNINSVISCKYYSAYHVNNDIWNDMN